MTRLDLSRMTPAEKLDLIGELWDSLEAEHLTLTVDQAAELDRRYATIDSDIEKGRDALSVYNDLTARYR